MVTLQTDRKSSKRTQMHRWAKNITKTLYFVIFFYIAFKLSILYLYIYKCIQVNVVQILCTHWRSYHLCPECLCCTLSIGNVHISFVIIIIRVCTKVLCAHPYLMIHNRIMHIPYTQGTP